MGNCNDTNFIALNAVDQRIGEIVKCQHSRPVGGLCAHCRVLAQQSKRLIKCVGKSLYGDKSPAADVSAALASASASSLRLIRINFGAGTFGA